ncbi:MAG: DUF1427 family protein [Desulfosarcina sp.]|jgi:XapX domain-containing protein
MIASILGILLGLIIGAACRWIDIPLPAPPKLVGALLVVAMTVGFVATDTMLTRHSDLSIV